MTASSGSESRSQLLGEAFVESVRGTYEFRQFCSQIQERESVAVSIGADVFILSRAGLVPISLTPIDESEWLSRMGRTVFGKDESGLQVEDDAGTRDAA